MVAQRFGRCGLVSSLLRLSVFFLFVSPFASAQFFQPETAHETWTVGDVIEIPYHTTMRNYTIALWKEAKPGNKQGRAILGPVLVRTERGPHTEFKWQVQLYDFDLKTSNVFFFWLKHGGPDNQKNMDATAIMSSHYFKIKRKGAPGDPPKTSTASATITNTREGVPTAPSSSLPATETSTATRVPSDNVETPSPDESSAASGLPVGAQVGIGVGVSVVGLVCIFCGVLWFRYIRKKQRFLAGLEQSTAPSESPPMHESWKPPVVPPAQSYYYPVEMDTSRHAAELHSEQGDHPRSAELPGDDHHWKGFDRAK